MARRRKPDPDEELDPDQLEELEEEGAFDSRGILKDGYRTTVKLYMRDGSIRSDLLPHQKAKAMQHTEDATARRFGLTDGLQLHRPGYRRVTDAAALERTRQAYMDYDTASAQAYQTRDYNEHTGGDPARTGAGAPNRGSGAPPGAYPLSSGEGTSCTINGAPGVLQREGAWLVCKPRQRQDAALFDAKAAAYAAYDREMADAWRSK